MIDPYTFYLRCYKKELKDNIDSDIEIIPTESPLYWKWGLPAFITIYRYFKFLKISENPTANTKAEFLDAAEKYLSAKFSCIYGKRLGEPLRKITKQIEDYNLTSRANLRALIYSRFFRETKNNEPYIIKSILLFIGDLYIAIASTFLLFIFTLALYYAPTYTIEKIGLYLAVSTPLIFSIYFQYYFGIKPFFIAKKLNTEFNKLKAKYAQKYKLKLVK